MRIGVPRETFPGEARVALVPATFPMLRKKGIEVTVESGAGEAAGFPDALYEGAGATVGSRADVFAADAIFQVRGLGTNPEAGREDLDHLREGQLVIGMLDPLVAHGEVEELARRGVSAFALELVPRITRAQSMDILSSQANLAGYKAVLLAADTIAKIFPMMMTAAGTIKPARVFVVGAGVAGLQAIATAKRLGAKVQAYDVRPAVKDQIESLGAKFVEMEIDAGEAEDRGGYAREMGEDFIRRQRELMQSVCEESDVVVTTAAIPGKRAPLLITAEMVDAMPPGAVIVDLAAPTGGNCELTQPDERVVRTGTVILGPTNLPSGAAHDASLMFSRNIATFLLNMVDGEGALSIDTEDEIVRDTLVTQGGEIVNARVREAMGLEPLTPAAATAQPEEKEANES
ncbi:Re/Si-specific NAD(P)(+) transhydrogenase subunit alpha [Candidatus Sumerlaeota bacterium]|nr:Re/Si-specific NAD(P)(+) transhydrogenase subunit alpha [Candidatus Sumerlaeota bacterium]